MDINSKWILLIVYGFLGKIAIVTSSIPKAPILPKECITSGVVPIPSSAESVPQTDFSSYETTEYQFPTVIMCAAVSNTNRAVGYLYKDGTCSIYGSGKGSFSSEVLFGAGNLPPIYSLEEVARGKPTNASSINSLYLIGMVNDGIIHVSGNMYHSLSEPYPWWMVDLEETKTIHQIQIFTRQDCCPWRFHDIEVRIGLELGTDGDFSSYALMSTYKGPYSFDMGHVICSNFPGIHGRYVVIQKMAEVDHTNPIQLSEVTVYAKKN